MIDRPVGPMPDEAVEGAGAVVCFRGVVRREESGRQLEGLVYTSYDPMAARELKRIAHRAAEQFGLLYVGITHSRGFVRIHETSLRLVVAAAHRKPALSAMDTILDELKRDVPIWKRPVWAENAEPIR